MNTFNGKHELEEHAKPHKQVLVLFCASWCPFCREFFAPFAKAVAKYSFDKVLRVYIDDNDNPLWEDYDIEAVPTVMLFEQGKATHRLDAQLGFGLNEKAFAEWLKAILPKS
jgi:thioredoxin-like negative regulator of GroEL